uniref:Putative secreted protein n=1 Tax=Anopheles marajoara TaxID=58244 RepID=A0A2M4CDK4_9DIPT
MTMLMMMMMMMKWCACVSPGRAMATACLCPSVIASGVRGMKKGVSKWKRADCGRCDRRTTITHMQSGSGKRQ